MTQAPVHMSFSRKRLADGPLPPPYPLKHPRITGNDPPRKIYSFVKNIFRSESDSLALPVYFDMNAMRLPTPSSPSTYHTQAPLAPSPTPEPESSESEAPEPPKLPPKAPRRSRSLSQRRAFSSTSQPRPDVRTSPDSSGLNPQDPGISQDRARRASLESSPRPQHFPRSSSSVHHDVKKGSKSIVHASQWNPLPGVKKRVSCTQSSIASTSKTTLDSTQSSINFNSPTGSRSPATSATSAFSGPPDGFGSLTPHPKPLETTSSNPLQYRPTLPFDSDTYLSFEPLRNLRTPTNSTFSIASTSSSHASKFPRYTSDYAPNPHFDDSKLLYTPGIAFQRKPPKRGHRRSHIFERQHKATLAHRRSEIKEDVRGHWFAKAKSQGFTGNRAEFDEYTDYALKAAKAVGEDSESQRDEVIWLGWYIDNARKSFKGPRPQKPFFPTLEQLSRTVRAKDAAIEDRLRPPRPQLPSSLPPDDEKLVDAVLRKLGVIAKVAREQIVDQDIRRLQPRQWLNDEIINFYGAMIMARAEDQKENIVPRGEILRAFYLSTFFWSKLTRDGYEKGRLAKWTKKVDIFSRDVILIPVNHGNAHWTAAAINFQKKRFESYDSMGMAKDGVWKQLREYVNAEHLNKRKKPFNFTGWVDWAPDDTPQQDNGYDCGVFTCQFLESLSRGEDGFVFTQEDMPYLRRRMVWEIANVRLRNDV